MRRIVTMFILAAGLAAAPSPERADACGGCFGPSGQVTVATAHRMAVSISPTQTTLWDQIEYAGDPADFAWVLPIAGQMTVELADNAFFEALTAATQINLQGTFSGIGPCPDPCSLGGGGFAAASESDRGTAEPPVTVYAEKTIGPYETATIGSEDPMALVKWLQDNGYAVDDAILPTIAYYVEKGMNFAALRLAPDAGVNQMQPVRVTTPGLMPVFPLRMVAAGVSQKVGLELYIFAEGQYEASNFPIARIDDADLTWDWETSSFDYEAMFQQKIKEAGGRAWVMEYGMFDWDWQYLVADYVSYPDDTGEPHYAGPDLEIALTGGQPHYLTKLRTDLAARYLDQDLVLVASNGEDIGRTRFVSAEINRPTPTCRTTCESPDSPSATTAGARFSEGERGQALCAVHPAGSNTRPFVLPIMMLALGLALARRRR